MKLVSNGEKTRCVFSSSYRHSFPTEFSGSCKIQDWVLKRLIHKVSLAFQSLASVNFFWSIFQTPHSMFWLHSLGDIFSSSITAYKCFFPSWISWCCPMLPLKYFQLQSSYFSWLWSENVFHFLSCNEENLTQVKWRDCNWIWRIWARSCLGAVLPTWRSDWSLCYNILDQNYNALLYAQLS